MSRPTDFAARTAIHCLAALLCLGLPCAFAQREQAAGTDQPITTQHIIHVHGTALAYTARAGYLSLRDAQNVVHGRMFYVAYTAKSAATPGPRPTVFVWNGGPGSNAGLLELGAMGPRRLPDRVSGHADLTGPLVDNEDTWLRFADLVFVDPIFTGYSYATTPEFQHAFLSDRGDADSVAEFVRLYRAHYSTERQPVYLMGESYGTYRAAGVADILQKRHIPVSGIMLLSTVLSFGGSNPDLSQAFLLPNYAAAAYAQQKVTPQPADLDQLVSEVERWSEGSYLAALVAGDQLSGDEKGAVASKLAVYTGISASVWSKANLRLSPDQFAIDVLDPNGRSFVGHYDTRVVGTLSRPNAPYDVDRDPSLDNGLDAHIIPYLRDELGWNSDMLYAGPFGGRWPSAESPRADWTSVLWNRDGGSPDRAMLLASELKADPQLRVFIASGYFDLATPIATVDYAVSHLFLPDDARWRVKTVRYRGGHAAYMDPQVRAELSKDAAAFITVGSPPM